MSLEDSKKGLADAIFMSFKEAIRIASENERNDPDTIFRLQSDLMAEAIHQYVLSADVDMRPAEGTVTIQDSTPVARVSYVTREDLNEDGVISDSEEVVRYGKLR